MEGTGSAIIVLRHLRRLAARKWKISVVAEWGQNSDACSRENWSVFNLSHRKPWWPPYRPGNALLRSIRLWLWAGECHGFLGGEKPDAVFTYLSAFSDILSQVALAYSRRYKVPLTVIIHDDVASFPGNSAVIRRRYEKILRNAQQNWFASPQLADIYNVPESKRTVLPPICEGWDRVAKWIPEFTNRPLIVYAGNVWEAQLPVLARVASEADSAGARLMLLVKSSPAVDALCREYPVEWKEPFESNEEALEFLCDNTAAVLVSYADTTADMPWVKTSFPSKLVEYTHLGLPVLILAPPDSAVAVWAADKKYSDSFAPGDTDSLRAFIDGLRSKSTWENKAKRSLHFAKSEFDPHRIQENFEKHLCA